MPTVKKMGGVEGVFTRAYANGAIHVEPLNLQEIWEYQEEREDGVYVLHSRVEHSTLMAV